MRSATSLWIVPGWRRLLAFAFPPAFAGALLLASWCWAAPAPPAPPPYSPAAADTKTPPPPPGILVHVSGAVTRPGLYRMHRGDRAQSALAAAGGLTVDADPNRLPDLATVLRDGQQIKVPSRSGGPGGTRSAKLSLNQATADQLGAIPGFTPELVTAALDYRSAYGGFRSTRELVTQVGMSQAGYAQARRFLTP
jgi:competence protein ComEA